MSLTERSLQRAKGAASAFVVALVLSSALSGCATVAPWQRSHLARPGMVLGGKPDLATGEEHAQMYREGSSGGGSVKSGGCGCN